MENKEGQNETTEEKVAEETEVATEKESISQAQVDDKEPQGENASFINDQNEEEIKEIRGGAGEDSEKPQTDDKPTERKKESTSEETTGPIVEKVPVDATSEEPVQTSKGNEDRELETTETGEETGTGPEDKDQSSSDTPKNPSEKDESKQGSSSSRTSSREGAEKKSLSGRGDRERKRDRKKKKQKGVPKLRRRTSKTGNVAEQYLQSILLSYFQAYDQMNSGLITQEDFWTILLSTDLNLQLNNVDIQILQDNIQADAQGFIPYMDFVAMAQQLITTVYHGQPDSQNNWVELRGFDGTVVNYNKKTGEIIDDAELGMDLFEETMKDLFQTADTEKKGHVTKEQFRKMLEKTKDLSLKPVEQEELVSTFPEGEVGYSEFQPIAKEMILRIYRARDESDSEWVQMSSPKVGWFFLNKMTGETRRNPEITEDREQEAALINQAYSQIDSLNLQLEQERGRTRELENQVATANEELEATHTQLDETGRQLDEAYVDLQLKETEVSELQSIIQEKDEYIVQLDTQVAEVTALKELLVRTQSELEEMKRLLQERDTKLAGKDQTIEDLKQQSDAITEELKNAHGVIDARESSIDSLQYNLSNEQGTVKKLKQEMPSLETRLARMMNELATTKHSLEEKSATLLQTRKSLKIAREKNSELDKEVAKLSQDSDKLKVAECEIKTLKSFLTSKTAMVERRKKEIQELKLKLSEIESRDNRRAIILADVLEKTARSYHQKLTSPKQQIVTETEATDGAPPTGSRPLSAPIAPLEEVLDSCYVTDPLSMSYQSPPTRGRRLITDQYHTPTAGKTTGRSQHKKGHIKARTVPRLPPIRKQKSDFVIPTQHEISKSTKERDAGFHPHTSSVNCRCELCTLNRRSPATMGYSVSDGGVALSRLRLETDQKEYQLSKQLKVGQRVVIQIKKSMYDLEPQKLTGIIKYIGKIDSEYIDNRIYVGVKLDDPVGNMDGVYKGKRYFTCLPSHGRMVRITSVIAVMPNKSVVYKPLQIGPQVITSSSGSPYMNNTMLQSKKPPLRVA